MILILFQRLCRHVNVGKKKVRKKYWQKLRKDTCTFYGEISKYLLNVPVHVAKQQYFKSIFLLNQLTTPHRAQAQHSTTAQVNLIIANATSNFDSRI